MRKGKTVFVLFLIILVVAGIYAYSAKRDTKTGNDKPAIGSLSHKAEKKEQSRYLNKYGKEKLTVRLLGKREDSSFLKLIWVVKGWPEDTAGFVVKRKGDDGNWSKLSDPIYPCISANREWKSMGMNSKQSEEMQKFLEDMVSRKRVKFVKNKEFIAYLDKYGMKAGDSIRISKDVRFAFITGMGYVDNDPLENGEYGVFSVSPAGIISEKPLAVYKNQPLTDVDLKIRDLKAVYSDNGFKNGIKVSWAIPVKTYSCLGLIECDVYKRNNDTDKWKKIKFAYGRVAGDQRLFEVYDSSDEALQPCEYAVTPLDYFKQEYPKTVITFNPDVDGPLSGRPQMENIVPEPPMPAPKNFTVKRIKNKDGKYHLEFSWAPVKGATNYTLFSKLSSEPEQKWCQFKVIRKFDGKVLYDYPSIAYRERVMDFAVEAGNLQVWRGIKACVNNVKIPPVNITPVRKTALDYNCGRAVVKWDYDPDVSVKALDVYYNGKLYKTLPPDAKSITIDNVQPDNGKKQGPFNVEIHAVSELCKAVTKCGRWINRVSKEEMEMPVPQNLKAVQVTENGEKYFRITWENVDQVKNNWTGIALDVSVKEVVFSKSILDTVDKFTGESSLFKIPAKTSFKKDIKTGMTFTFKAKYYRIRRKPEWARLYGPSIKTEIKLK